MLAQSGIPIAPLFDAQTEKSAFIGTVARAAEATALALKHGKGRINILLHSLPDDQFDSPIVVTALKSFLNRPDTSLFILVETTFDPAQSVFADALSFWNAKIRARKVRDEVRESYKYNFLTVDGAGFLFQDDREIPVGVAASGGEDFIATARHLDKIFGVIWEMSDPIELTTRVYA